MGPLYFKSSAYFPSLSLSMPLVISHGSLNVSAMRSLKTCSLQMMLLQVNIEVQGV